MMYIKQQTNESCLSHCVSCVIVAWPFGSKVLPSISFGFDLLFVKTVMLWWSFGFKYCTYTVSSGQRVLVKELIECNKANISLLCVSTIQVLQGLRFSFIPLQNLLLFSFFIALSFFYSYTSSHLPYVFV